MQMDEIDHINKEAVKIDLQLIKSCLRLVNQTITLSKRRGEDFTASENLEIHMLISKIDEDLGKIKVNIQYETSNTTHHQTR